MIVTQCDISKEQYEDYKRRLPRIREHIAGIEEERDALWEEYKSLTEQKLEMEEKRYKTLFSPIYRDENKYRDIKGSLEDRRVFLKSRKRLLLQWIMRLDKIEKLIKHYEEMVINGKKCYEMNEEPTFYFKTEEEMHKILDNHLYLYD